MCLEKLGRALMGHLEEASADYMVGLPFHCFSNRMASAMSSPKHGSWEKQDIIKSKQGNRLPQSPVSFLVRLKKPGERSIQRSEKVIAVCQVDHLFRNFYEKMV